MSQEWKARLAGRCDIGAVLLIVHLFIAPNAGTKGMWCAWGWESTALSLRVRGRGSRASCGAGRHREQTAEKFQAASRSRSSQRGRLHATSRAGELLADLVLSGDHGFGASPRRGRRQRNGLVRRAFRRSDTLSTQQARQ